MCDTLCAIGNGRTLFAKNSDRPHGEVQVVEAFARRDPGGTLRTQYLEIPDAGAWALLGSRPAWLWGFEHGVNEHRVAIGNEAVYTTANLNGIEPALIGMDLVRLGLERAATAALAIDEMTDLLDRYGQGGDCSEDGGTYSSSFLVADPTEAWVLETAGRTWAARRFAEGAAISNRLSLRADWDRASADVEPGADFDGWRDPGVGTGFADVRLASSRACLERGVAGPGELAGHLRDHGEGGRGLTDDEFSVCMHIRGAVNTTSAMVCELDEDPAVPLRAWIALGSPCASVFVPVFPSDGVPSELADEKTWRRFAMLRDRVEVDDAALAEIRAVLGPLEAELWEDADRVAGDRGAERSFVASVGPRLEAALDQLA